MPGDNLPVGLGEGRALERFWEKVLGEALFSPAHE